MMRDECKERCELEEARDAGTKAVIATEKAYDRKVRELQGELKHANWWRNRLRIALELIHDWAALGGEHGAQPHARIMTLADRTLSDESFDPRSMA